MTPEEHDALILAVDHIREIKERHSGCLMPARVDALERKKDRIEAVVALILVLVAAGRIVDLYELMTQLIFHS